MAFGFSPSPLSGLAAAARAATAQRQRQNPNQVSPRQNQGNPFAYFRGIYQRQQNPFANFTTANAPGTVPIPANPGLRAYAPPSPTLARQLNLPQPPDNRPPAVNTGQGSVAPPVGSPLDSTFWQNVAAQSANTNNSINALNLQGANAQTDLQTSLARLAAQEPLDQLRLTEQANARGALLSSPTAMQMSGLIGGYSNRQADLNQNFTRAQAARAARVSALRSALQQYASDQYESSAQRASALAAGNSAAGESSGPLTPPPPATPPSPPPTGQRPSQQQSESRFQPGMSVLANPQQQRQSEASFRSGMSVLAHNNSQSQTAYRAGGRPVSVNDTRRRALRRIANGR